MTVILKSVYFLLLFLSICFISYSTVHGIEKSQYLPVNDPGVDRQQISRSVMDALLDMRNSRTKMVRSHWGHPGFEKLGFLYDNCVVAMVLNSAGHKQEAEDILDYIVSKFRVPRNWVEANEDCHNLFGIVKLVRTDNGALIKSVINTINIENDGIIGKGIFEYNTTPGPLSYLVYALLNVNPDKYLNDAVNLGNVLLAFQKEDGSVPDGDRNTGRVYTDTHINSHAAFRMLYSVTKVKKWKIAADRSMEWFKKNVYDRVNGRIYQGIWEGGNPNMAFAGGSYYLLISGPAGDELPLNELKKITDHWINRTLAKITLKLPDQSYRTLVLADFTDASDDMTKQVRQGFHPMGSPEWTGGAILALQKNSVRFWNAGDKVTARFYKSVAEILLNQVFHSYYRIPGLKGMLTFYATAQNECVGPFGNGVNNENKGWVTPVFYFESMSSAKKIAGGSAIGCWPMLAFYGLNPLLLNDPYKKTYDLIDMDTRSGAEANEMIARATASRTYREKVPAGNSLPEMQIMEPGLFTERIWNNLNQADRCRDRKDAEGLKAYYQKVIDDGMTVLKDAEWVRLAKLENGIKQKEIGGIVWYPWGRSYANNDGELLNQILRYPILNELSVAVYGLVVANYELGNQDEVKRYMEMMIDDYPLHQIAVLDNSGLSPKGLISGFWNALVSWEDSMGRDTRDGELGKVYEKILKERKLGTRKPDTIFFEMTKRYHELHERLAYKLKSDGNP